MSRRSKQHFAVHYGEMEAKLGFPVSEASALERPQVAQAG